MKRPVLHRFSFVLLSLLVATLTSSVLFHNGPKKPKKIVQALLKPIEFGATHCDSLFNDLPWAHKSAYDSLSIGPFKSGKELYEAFLAGSFIEISGGDDYELDTLTHSYPYLLPSAKQFLDDLGIAYRQSCALRRIPYQRYTITSVTRTISSVRRLRRINRNSIRFSPHLKGKTIDIASDRFEGKQLPAFIFALNELRRQKRCYVKYESIQGCFHITVRS